MCIELPGLSGRPERGFHRQFRTALASASALRKFIFQDTSDQKNNFDTLNQMLTRTVPDSVRELLLTAYESHAFLQEDDFSDLLYYELQRQLLHPTASDADTTRSDLTQRIANKLESFTCWSEFVSDLKTKNQTYTAISRYLLHALLGIDGELLNAAKTYYYSFYLELWVKLFLHPAYCLNKLL